MRYTDDGEEVLSQWNPAQVTAGETSEAPTGRGTKLVQLLLTVGMSNYREANLSYVQLPIRVMPRH